MEGVLDEGGKNFALISKNFFINPKSTQGLLHQNQRDIDIFKELTDYQSYSEALPVRDKMLAKATGRQRLYAQSWVGMDMLLESTATGEPELHIILRGTEKAPIFPKTSPEKKALLEIPEARPELAPGLVPIRHK
jgi:hypothetical protein